MEGILAVAGFWIVMLAIVMKKPLMTYLENKKAKGVSDADANIIERVQNLEGSMVTMGKDIQEMKDTSEFAHKLMIDSAQQIAEAHKLLTRMPMTSHRHKNFSRRQNTKLAQPKSPSSHL